MYCEKCGTKLEDNARFCPNCGSPVGSENIPKGNEEDNINQEREQDIFKWEAPFVPDNQPSQGGKGGNKTTWIVSIAVTIAIILVTGGLIWYLLKPDSAPKDDVVVNPVKTAMKETSEGSGESEETEDQESNSIEITEKSEETKPDESSETENVEIKIGGAANTDKKTQDSAQEAAPASGEEKLSPDQGSEKIQNTEQQATENHPEPAPASVSEEATASAVLYEGTPDVSFVKRGFCYFCKCYQPFLRQNKQQCHVKIKRKDDTSWQEGVSGYGINESVSFSFDDLHKVKYIAFKLGNWKNDKYYYGNAKPKTINLVFGDYSGQVTFTGERKVEWVEVSPSVNADSMRLELKDVYPGTSWEDTCISEVTVYAE